MRRELREGEPGRKGGVRRERGQTEEERRQDGWEERERGRGPGRGRRGSGQGAAGTHLAARLRPAARRLCPGLRFLLRRHSSARPGPPPAAALGTGTGSGRRHRAPHPPLPATLPATLLLPPVPCAPFPAARRSRAPPGCVPPQCWIPTELHNTVPVRVAQTKGAGPELPAVEMGSGKGTGSSAVGPWLHTSWNPLNRAFSTMDLRGLTLCLPSGHL